MNKKKKTIIILVSLFFLFIPLFYVQSAGLVPCGGADEEKCTFCDLFALMLRIMNWGTSILVFLAIAGIVISGIMYIVSAGSPGMMEQAKSFLKVCIIGVAIVLLSWMIVRTTIFLLGANFENLGISGGTDFFTVRCQGPYRLQR